MTATDNTTKASQPLVASDDEQDELFAGGRAPERRGWRIVAIGAVVVLLAAVVGVALASTRASGPRYRVATVTNADATAVLNGVATIVPMSQATVAFPTAGTIKAVAVKAGQKVVAGQTLAVLDPKSLYVTIHSKQASLAQAQLNLQNALDGKSSGLSSGGGGGGANGGTGGASATFTAATTNASAASATLYATPPTTTPATIGANPRGGGTSSSNPQIAAAQRAVVAAQARVDRALAAADAAMRAAETVCGGTAPHAGATAAAARPPRGSTTTSASTTSTTTGGPPPGGSCAAALQASLAAQQAVSTAQRALDAAAQHLTKLLDDQASNPTTPPTGANNGGSAPSGVTGSQQATTKAATAADLAAYQVRVDAAQANLVVAEQALAQARITSPINGTVMAVSMAAGDSVTAASSTATVVVSGAKGYEVTTSVPVTQIARVSVGQTATVLPDGAAGPITGTVSTIAAVPASSSSSTTTYNVIVSLVHPPATLHSGATGSVSIITDAAKAALVVPSSGVHATGRRHTVTVALGGSRTKTVDVTVGVQGATMTQIKGGLAAGQEVVIADLDKALPTSATSTQSNSGTNRNGFTFPGGGGPPAGFNPFGGRGG